MDQKDCVSMLWADGLSTASPGNILHISSADPRLRITDTSGTTSNVQADILFQAGLVDQPWLKLGIQIMMMSFASKLPEQACCNWHK